MRAIVANLTAPHRHKNKYCSHCQVLENEEDFSKAFEIQGFSPIDILSFMNNIKNLNQQLYEDGSGSLSPPRKIKYEHCERSANSKNADQSIEYGKSF